MTGGIGPPLDVGRRAELKALVKCERGWKTRATIDWIRVHIGARKSKAGTGWNGGSEVDRKNGFVVAWRVWIPIDLI